MTSDIQYLVVAISLGHPFNLSVGENITLQRYVDELSIVR